MESEAEMKTLDNRVTSLEKRIDKHGQEIDDLDDRVSEVESNQKLFQLQLEALTEIKEGINALNKNVLSINDTVTESKHKLEMVSSQQHADKEEIKQLKIQRDLDHNVKPLSRYEDLQKQILYLVVGAIVAIILARVGLSI